MYHNNEYKSSLNMNWDTITGKIKKHSDILLSRRLTLYQRVIYANTCLLSKLWYVAHVYPLTGEHSKKVNTIIFQYIWGGRYEPIKRATIYRPK